MSRSKLPRSVSESLRAIPILRACTDRELVVVAQHTTVHDVEPGFVLCREGTPGVEAFIIVSGEADVRVGDVPVARLAGGDVCGEMALLDLGQRTATVTASTPMRVLAMSRSDFTSLVTAVPTFTRQLLERVASRLRDADAALRPG